MSTIQIQTITGFWVEFEFWSLYVIKYTGTSKETYTPLQKHGLNWTIIWLSVKSYKSRDTIV